MPVTETLALHQRHVDEIVKHARELDPVECTGIIAGMNGRFEKLFRMTNVANSPYRFEWDGRELLNVYREMEDAGWDHRAVYHSHTHSQAYPSQTDVRMAAWPEAYYLIVSLADKANPLLRGFRIVDGKITEVDIEAETT